MTYVTGGDESKDGSVSHPEPEPLILEIRVRGCSHVYELRGGEERAVTVGSSPRADLQLTEPGIAPVHFHFEREADEVWLIPTASAGRLRVNSNRIHGRCQLGRRAVLEWGGLTVEVRVTRKAGSSRPCLETQSFELAMDGVDYVKRLPEEGDTTVLGLHGAGSTEPDVSFPTTALPISRQFITAPMPVVPVRSYQFVTERMPIIAPLVVAEPVIAPSRSEPSRSERVMRSSQTWETTSIATLRVAWKPSEGRAAHLASKLMGWVRTLIQLVARLGTETQQHPLRVLAFSFGLAVTMGAIAAGISRLAHQSDRPHMAHYHCLGGSSCCREAREN